MDDFMTITTEEFEARQSLASLLIGDLLTWWAVHMPGCGTHEGNPCTCGMVVGFGGLRHVIAVDENLGYEVETLH